MTTRRKQSRLVEPELAFDIGGDSFGVGPGEIFKLIGLGMLPIALYLFCFKPFMKDNGRVSPASWYRCGELLRVHRAGPGRRPPSPSKQQLRDALTTLIAAKLVTVDSDLNERRGVLQIWLCCGVGGTSAVSIRPGYRTGSRRPQTRANA